MVTSLRISRSLRDRIVAEAAASRDEICGLLLGEAGRVVDALSCANVHPTPKMMFELDPAVLFAALRHARAGGPRIIGHYHSHPSGDARPSATDAASAPPDDAYWLIVAGADVTSWQAVRDGTVHGRFDPVALAIAR
jgi:proteasome lid subunit RPN8/RPN11